MRGRVRQLEIIELNFLMPEGNFEPHPALVLSSDELFDDEEIFYAVLMTTKNIFPKYTLRIDPEMLTKPGRPGYFATHLVHQCTMNDVLQRQNVFLKAEYFQLVKEKIIDSIFVKLS